MNTEGSNPPELEEVINRDVTVGVTPAAVTAPAPYRVSAPPNEVVDPAHVHLSPQSIWPITMAFGISLAGLGIVSLIELTVIGVLLVVLALVMWIRELRHEYD